MNRPNTDIEWEKWGQQDPYFGVLTDEKFRSRNLTPAAKEEFFESGRQHIQQVLEVCRRHVAPNLSLDRVLDFGCGVGRLVIPFAEVARQVVGVDISDSMLKEAEKNCEERSVRNAQLVKSDDALSAIEGEFDLIHSFIVLQHIPVERGRAVFAKLLEHLKPGGVAALQITYSSSTYKESGGVPQAPAPIARLLQIAKRLLRGPVRVARRISRGRPRRSADPGMEMNPYSLNNLFFIIQSTGATDVHVQLTDHGGQLGTFLFFARPIAATPEADIIVISH